MAGIGSDRTYSDMLFIGGGQGASAHGDGKSGLLWPTSAANTSIELFEARVPGARAREGLRARTPADPADIAAASASASACASCDDDGLTTLVSVYPEGVEESRLPACSAGKPGGGARGRVRAIRAATSLHDCGTGDLVQVTRTDEIVEIVLAGGAGYGDPRTSVSARPVEHDLALGLVTHEGAAPRLWLRSGSLAAIGALKTRRMGADRLRSGQH